MAHLFRGLLVLAAFAPLASADIVVDTPQPVGNFVFAANDETFSLRTGGLIDGDLIFGGQRNTIGIEGGLITGKMSFSGIDDVITITGGAIAGGVSFSGVNNVFHVFGGEVGTNWSGSGINHGFNFYGTGLAITDPAPFTKRVTGVLFDGTTIDLKIATGAFVEPRFAVHEFGAQPTPEPGTLALLGAVCIGAALIRKRRRTAHFASVSTRPVAPLRTSFPLGP